MARFWLDPPKDATRYVLGNVHIPPALCDLTPGANGWCNADVVIEQGVVGAVMQAGFTPTELPLKDVGKSILLSGLVDCHTHLDKAHVAGFDQFEPGDLASAIQAMALNKQGWTRESLAARVEFSLRSAWAYGMRAMRSHVDCNPVENRFVLEVMEAAKTRWAGRIDLQLSSLAGIDAFADPAFAEHVFDLAEKHGRFGVFLFDQPDLRSLLVPLFEIAGQRGWDLDFHVDEGLAPELNGLEILAQVANDTGYQGTVLCGHCVALSGYEAAHRDRVIDLAIKAGLHFVALPSSNLYLQSRDPDNVPTLRGMAPVARLGTQGAVVSMGADNVRDGFCAFGDFDPMAVLNLGAQVGHLHEPARDWAALITTNPAKTMGLDWDGRITAGAPADLVLFAARNSGEMNLCASPERIVIWGGEWLNIDPPAFSELTE